MIRVRFHLFLGFAILLAYVNSAELQGSSGCFFPEGKDDAELADVFVSGSFQKMDSLNALLLESLKKNDFERAANINNEIKRDLSDINPDKRLLTEYLYYSGIFYNLTGELDSAVENLERVIELKEADKITDVIYSRALYNLGTVFSLQGKFEAHKNLIIKALEAEKTIYGPDSHELISTYGSLITAFIELKQYDKANEYTDLAYRVARICEKEADAGHIAFLYANMGVLYNSIGDYSKGLVFLDKAEEFYGRSINLKNESLINLYNSKSYALKILDRKEEADDYFNKGVRLAMKDYSLASYYLQSLYAHRLAQEGNVKEGEKVLILLIGRVLNKEGRNSLDYHEILVLYADYLREYDIDKNKSQELYEKSIKFFNEHGNSFTKTNAYIGLATILDEKGDFIRSVRVLQGLLYTGIMDQEPDLFSNPEKAMINADKDNLNLLRIKYKILKKNYFSGDDIKILTAAAETSELIISLLEQMRISISEEESRLLLGEGYRDSYINTIKDYYTLALRTGQPEYLKKTFEYSEKSKIAGLLASTRELKATEFHIPFELARQEKELQTEIAILNDRISGKSSSGVRSKSLVDSWKNNLFLAVLKRDSLIKVFEKEYPDYYALKYNTGVLSPEQIRDVIGRKSNYLSFVASDSLLYISVVNSKHYKFLEFKIDSTFYKNIKRFRELISNPDFSDARKDFTEYQQTGRYLNNILLEPVRDYLISDRLIISPDNLISYVPFEIIPDDDSLHNTLSYKDIHYLMNEYDISYTYSATYLSENKKRNYSDGSKAIAFAPDYSVPVNIETLSQKRQKKGDYLADLPFARTEAGYVAEIFGGKLFTGNTAKESVFKREAGNYDIIHLAMHTVLNDNDPMYSTLIFSPDSAGNEDSFLRTYEIYGIPLRARMVVLSSCNTGSGRLYSGEGILSLARGFIYSGSESVVMSMWEIEDRTGTEIVKLYYDFLKKGFTKSKALRKARKEFLKSADQLRAHPYFWSTLVVYGDNEPVVRPYKSYLLILVSVVILLSVFIAYGRWRRYS